MNTKEIFYIGEAASGRTNLPVGTPVYPTDASDPYRILGPLERFYRVDVDSVETLFGLNLSDLERVDPLSREARGPWVHDLKVKVDYDSLPKETKWVITTCKIPGTIYVSTTVCIDMRKFTIEEHQRELQSAMVDHKVKLLSTDDYIVLGPLCLPVLLPF